jgi:hypothetical protein
MHRARCAWLSPPPRRREVSDDVPPFPDAALHVRSIVREEQRRWVLYLEFTMMPDTPDHVVTHRIADYPTQRHADLAAQWMVRAAERDLPHPPLGF